MRADQHRRVRQALGLALTCYGFALGFRPVDEADTFFHLSLGRAVLRAGSRTVPEPTAFVDFTAPAVASEWLWSVFSYLVYELGGFALLSGMAAGLAALACCSAYALAQRSADAEASPWLVHAFSVLAVCAISVRISARPELALLIALPWFIIAVRAYAAAPATKRLGLGLGLALGCVVWAQLHASFVLCPALFVLFVLRRPAHVSRAQLRVDGLTLALLLAGMLTNPFGADVADLISSHAAGDAPRYIAEMASPTWGMLNPFETPHVFAYYALLASGCAGALLARQVQLRELLAALLGCALLATASRFIAEAALLAVPWANRGAGALTQHFAPLVREHSVRMWRSMLVAGAVLLLGLSARQVQSMHGPLGRLGVAEHAFALHAAQSLKQLPEGSAVMTDYTSSAVVGFVGGQRLRTFVDGRTPLYFDATDFAIAREMARDGDALRNGIARYSARAAVVRRDSEACTQLAGAWAVALVEPLFTTFVDKSATAPITQLQPCGFSYFPREACADPRLQADIRQLRAVGAHEFARFLEADRAVRCGGELQPALRWLRAIEPDTKAFRYNFDRVMIEALLRDGTFEEANERMLAAIARDDLGIVKLLSLPAAGEMPLEAARTVLVAYVERSGDDADLGVRAALAELCARAGDQTCARFHATRAAVRGRHTNALDWLASHHDDERVRRDAQRWLEVLGRAAARPDAAAWAN